jgi:hypothetical protein
MYRAIPGVKILEEDRENQHEGKFGGLHPPMTFLLEALDWYFRKK